jgi:tight adherence protein B
MFGVVLVLDTSNSMAGKPLAATLAAEQAFAAQRNPNERLGVIDFNRNSTIVLPLTTSAARLAAALAVTPPGHTGRHFYDAVAQAEATLTAAHVGSGTIIVLSDGADTGSAKTLNQVATAARQANTRIDTVGLKDKAYKSGTLKGLAAAANGAYARATTQQLGPLFARLSRQHSNEHLLRYTSLAGPNKPVVVKVQVKGVGTARAHYRTPALPVTSTRERP